MKFSQIILALLATAFPLSEALDVDCSMADTTPCDCIFAPGANGTLSGTDCRVCRVEKLLMCVLWGSYGIRYGPLCENPKCTSDQTCTPTKCYREWQPKYHERMPCPTPAGDCKCSFQVRGPTATSMSAIPGETCTVCPVDQATPNTPYYCTETGNKKVQYGPLCMGLEITPADCPGKKSCVCNWMVTQDGDAWFNNGTT